MDWRGTGERHRARAQHPGGWLRLLLFCIAFILHAVYEASFCREIGMKQGTMHGQSPHSSLRELSDLDPLLALQVPGCEVDLSTLSGYHRRHRVCHIHLKTPEVQLHGQLARFCQQCGRFQPLEDFQDTRRSCKAALRAHNERRRQNTIASDNALAHTRFSTSTSTSRRSTLSTAAEQHPSSGAGLGGSRRQLAKAASLRSNGYSAEGVGALRRTISHSETCRSMRPSSHGYEAWSGSYSLSDGAACLQPQQQQYSLADSPTASSGSTVAVQHASSVHSTRLRTQERHSQNTHLQALALHQRQHASQLTPDWHSGCNPAIAQLDAAQLLQAAAAAGQAAAACLAPQGSSLQLHRSAPTRQQLQQLSLSAGALPAWQQHMAPAALQQQQQLLPPCTQGLAAAPGMLEGWQQQQFVPGCQGLDTVPIAWPQQQLLHAPNNTLSGSAVQCAGMDASLSGWHAQASVLETSQGVLQPQLQQQSVIAAASVGWPAAGLQPIVPYSLGEGCHMSDNWGEGCHMQGVISTSASAQQLETQHPAVAPAMPSAQHAPRVLALTDNQCTPLPQQQTALQHATETPAVHAPAGSGLLPMPDSSSAPSVTLQPPTTGQQALMPPPQTHEQGSYQARLLVCAQVVDGQAHLLHQQLQDSSAQAAVRIALGCITKQGPQQQLEAQAPAPALDTLPMAHGACPDTVSAVQLSSSSGARASRPDAAAVAAASAPAQAASNSCMLPELSFWECMAAAETADDFSSEEIDALLEHAFGDFIAPATEDNMCETAAGPGCCGSSVPSSPAADCAPPAGGAAACTARSHAL